MDTRNEAKHKHIRKLSLENPRPPLSPYEIKEISIDYTIRNGEWTQVMRLNKYEI